MVGNINDPGIGAQGEDHALHNAHIFVLQPKIGEEGNYRRGHGAFRNIMAMIHEPCRLAEACRTVSGRGSTVFLRSNAPFR